MLISSAHSEQITAFCASPFHQVSCKLWDAHLNLSAIFSSPSNSLLLVNNPEQISDELQSDTPHPIAGDSAWASVLSHVEPHVSGDNFKRWFAGTTLLEHGEGELVIGVPNSIHQFFIESNFLKTLRLAAGAVMGETLGAEPMIRFRITGKDKAKVPIDSGFQPDSESLPTAAKAHPSVSDVVELKKVPAVKAKPERISQKSLETKMRQSGISPNRSFETYVVGASNQFAAAAAAQVAEKPGCSYNPLFLCGGSGLGKTHLMHAIGRQILETKTKVKVLYVTGEEFTNDFIEAVRENSITAMRKRYRKADVLLIDDVQFIAGKERTQEEFFHTFNALADGSRQIVLSSDKPPSEIPLLEKRLVSRFEWGLTASVQPPEIETRIAILQKKMMEQRVEIEPEILHFIAENIRHNVRRLEGALIRVASSASLHDGITIEEATDLLDDMLDAQQSATVTIDRIQKTVAEAYDIRIADMTSKRRPKAIAFPRQIAMHLARCLTSASYAEIGEAFGGRDHGTVMHACKKIDKDIKADPALKRTIGNLEEKLRMGEGV